MEQNPEEVSESKQSPPQHVDEPVSLLDRFLELGKGPARLSRLQWFLVWIFAGIIFVPNAGSFGLWDPWETHYGEVTRNMIETSDWVSPHWGFRSKVGTEPIAGKPFFSKPVFLFWIEAVTAKVIGMSDWAVRIPILLIAMGVLAVLAHCLSRIFSPLVGLTSVLIVGTSPQFFFLGRQAQTDMPFVGMMTIAMLFMMLGLFGQSRERTMGAFKWLVFGSMALIGISTIPQYGIIATDLFLEEDTGVGLVGQLWGNGIYHVAFYITLLVIFLGTVWYGFRADLQRDSFQVVQDRWSRKAYFWLFYVFCAHATLAKGLLGFLLPGAILFVFLLLTKGWKRIAEMEVPRGLLLFVAVGFPWYFAMFSKHGMAYYNRFFIHDHFNRMNSGVHQIDSGTFEHFLKWLSYGIWPWVFLIPVVLMFLLPVLKAHEPKRNNERNWFLFFWFFVSYCLFTVSSTKFHHYIFPALIPLAILLAKGSVKLFEYRGTALRLALLLGGALVLALGWDISQDPQTLRNLFTYKYDRKMPASMPTDVNAPVAEDATLQWGNSIFYDETNGFVLQAMNLDGLGYEVVIWAISLVSVFGLLLFVFRNTRLFGGIVIAISALFLSTWGLNVYLPSFSTHWSQKYLFESYYQHCTLRQQSEVTQEAYTPLLAHVGLEGVAAWTGGTEGKRVCEEDIISWLITWRGETYYGNNEVIPIQKEATQFEAYLRDYNRGTPFFVLMERGKEASWTKKLNGTYLPKVKEEEGFESIKRFGYEKMYDENHYFILVKISPEFK